MTELINLTRDTCYFYVAGKYKPVYILPSRGELGLEFGNPMPLPGLHLGPEKTYIEVYAGPLYNGIDQMSAGWPAWRDNPTASFIVPLAVAQFMDEHPNKVIRYVTPGAPGDTEVKYHDVVQNIIGERVVYALPEDPKFVVCDLTGAVKGVYMLDLYAGDPELQVKKARSEKSCPGK